METQKQTELIRKELQTRRVQVNDLTEELRSVYCELDQLRSLTVAKQKEIDELRKWTTHLQHEIDTQTEEWERHKRTLKKLGILYRPIRWIYNLFGRPKRS